MLSRLRKHLAGLPLLQSITMILIAFNIQLATLLSTTSPHPLQSIKIGKELLFLQALKRCAAGDCSEIPVTVCLMPLLYRGEG